jgi:methylenetetrahydrofolate reductase (NADPH)
MGILQKLAGRKTAYSFEFFPPKIDMPLETVYDAIDKLSSFEPAFVSVTYGAGGGNKDRAIEIAMHLKDSGYEAIAHLTCVGADKKSIDGILESLASKGIENILALRGDLREGMDYSTAFAHYRYASDLIKEIKGKNRFTIGAAAYPEAHVESESLDEDVRYMLFKEELGADFFITQLCFDKNALLGFYDKAGKAGVRAPIITGIMPVLNPNQITRMALLSACSIPAPLSRIISRYGNNAEDFKKAGLDFAIDEIEYLIHNGIKRFHIYTMNKPDTARQIIEGSSLKPSSGGK